VTQAEGDCRPPINSVVDFIVSRGPLQSVRNRTFFRGNAGQARGVEDISHDREEKVMSVRLTVLSVMLLAAAGCSSEPRQATQSPYTMGIGDVQKRDPLLSECRVPCTISPGPGCC